MGILDKAALDALIAAGCAACGETTLTFQTYVDGLIPLMAGEPVGKLKWVYNGEKFLDGIFEIACARCKKVVFTSPDCPRCHARGGLATALATENSYPVPTACPGCESEEVRYIAFMPAKATYEGKRAEKARTSVEMHDRGFHGYRVDCKVCGTVAELSTSCPLCAAKGPLRERPDDD
jgi:hypothetical protein